MPRSTWADTVQRAEDDAHTLTMAAQAQAAWVPWPLPAETGPAVRVEVPDGEPVFFTLTF
jgi:hypothetical protein